MQDLKPNVLSVVMASKSRNTPCYLLKMHDTGFCSGLIGIVAHCCMWQTSTGQKTGVMPKVIQTWHAKNWVLVKFESVQDHISTTLFSVLRAHPFRFLITKHKSSRELFNVYCDCAILLMTPSFPLVFVWITIQYWKWAGR